MRSFILQMFGVLAALFIYLQLIPAIVGWLFGVQLY